MTLKFNHFFLMLALIALPLKVNAQQPAPPHPSKGLMPNPTQGKRLFEKNCAQCHGVEMKGSDKGPPFLHPVYEPGHHGDASFQMAVKYGSKAHHWKFGDMRPIEGLSPDDVAHITAFVRQVQRQSGIQ